MKREDFLVVVAPHFTAAYDVTARRAAPIIAYMVGWGPRRVLAYCRRKGWGCIAAGILRPEEGPKTVPAGRVDPGVSGKTPNFGQTD
jgi:hypothetical protein